LTSATVTVNPAMSSGTIGPGFVGLSYEKSHLTDSFFTGENSPLIALCRLLGPSVLRLGGNSVDATSWDPTAPANPPATIGTTIGTADVDGLDDFLAATGWKALYAVGLEMSTPAAAAAEAVYAAGKLGGSLYGFEVGNEIDLYFLSYAQLLANWNAEADAITSAVPNATLTGPATSSTSLLSMFAHDEAGRIALLTQHYYRDNGGLPSATADELLSPDPALLSMLRLLSTTATANRISDGYRIAETNSFYNHGTPGVSNAFASALWVIDFLFTNAEHGSSGVNLHGGGAGQDGPEPFAYTPIEEVNGVVTGAQPIFYGMLFFTLAGTGTVYAANASADNLNFTAYAVGQADGSTNVALVNKDGTHAVGASVDMGMTVKTASAIYLEASSLTATTGVTLAGAPISPAGEWTFNAPWALPVSGHTVTVTVPAASAALVHVE
jgi:hypothetical protein